MSDNGNVGMCLPASLVATEPGLVARASTRAHVRIRTAYEYIARKETAHSSVSRAMTP